jgi:alkylation response protein AidB-like acyl-CoA dehydrogenase
MNFDLSDEQRSIADSFHNVLDDHWGDVRLIEYLTSRAFDRPLWREIAGLGVGRLLVSEPRGGLGMDLVTLAVVAEVLGSYATPLPVITNALAAWLLDQAGNDEQRARWLEPLMTGQSIAAFAIGEADDRWLPVDWTTEATAHQADSPTIVGEKSNVEWGTEADVLIVGLSDGRLGLAEPDKNVITAPIESLDLTRPLAAVEFKNANVQAIAADSDLVSCLIDAMLIMLAADACGAASSALQRAVAYAKERRQFNQTIGHFQSMKHQLADMAVELEPSRPLCWYAAHAWDVYPERRRRIAALAKAHVTDGATLVARAAVEAHGGIGYTWDYPIHVFLKRCVFDRAFLGAPRLHRERMARFAGW